MKKILLFVLLIAGAGLIAETITNVNVGTPNAGNGDPLRTAMIKLNENDNFLQSQVTNIPGSSLQSPLNLTTVNVGTVTITNPIAFNGALGTDDTANGFAISGLNAGATIAQWEAVYCGSSSTWLLADANGSGTYPARGVAVAAYSNGNAAVILREGTVRNDSWSWTAGGTLYLSGTAGALTQTAPSASGDKVQQVGFALSAHVAYLNFASGEYLTIP